jgi:hypothetical protein
MTMVAEHVRPRRRRADLIKDDRVRGLDMRTRDGRRFSQILAAVRSEFGDAVDPIRASEVARLRMIAEGAQRDALAGKLSLDRLVRISNLVVRSERQLTAVGRARPSHAGPDLASYLATLADAEPVEAEELDPVETVEVES